MLPGAARLVFINGKKCHNVLDSRLHRKLYLEKLFRYTELTRMSFFSRSIPVLFYSRKQLIVGTIKTGKKMVFNQVLNIDLDFNNLEKTLNQLKLKLGNSGWRVLISDELSYVFDLVFPKTTNLSRELIFKEVLQIVPEELTDLDWDYKFLPNNEADEQKIKVFSPVQEYWLKLKHAFSEAEIEVEAVESEEIALTRNSNALIGLALKTDLSGRDKNVLNLGVSKKPWIINLVENLNTKESRLIILILAIALGVFLASTGIIGAQLSLNN